MSLMFLKKMYTRTASLGVIAVTIFTAVVLSGCNASNSRDSENALKQQPPVSTQEQTASESTAGKQEEGKIMEEYRGLLANNAALPEIVKFMDKNISLVSNENAAVMLDSFEEIQKKLLPKLDEKFYKGDNIQNKLNKVYKPNFDINKLDDIDDTELKRLLIETRDSGYKVETAEGMFFPVINYEFYKKYSNYVASDIKEYINLMAVESNKTPAKDAALVISWEEVLKRAMEQESYISQYESSIKADEVKDLYKKYVTFTLLGANNTPLFSYDKKVMVPEAKKAYMNAMALSNNSELLENVAGLMKLLEKTDYKLTEEVDRYRKGVIEKG